MDPSGEGSPFQRFLFSVGYAAGTVDSWLRGKGNAAGIEDETGDAVGAGPRAPAGERPWAGAERGTTAGGTTAATGDALAAQVAAGARALALRVLLRPRPVHWPRAVLAGLLGTALFDLARLVSARSAAPGQAAAMPWAEDPAEVLVRYAAGVGTAAAYASLVYPRIPAPPLARGLIFGALDAAASDAGGAIELLHALSPGISFPLQQIALPLGSDGDPLPHLAFGLGLGLIYRDGRKKLRRKQQRDGDSED